MSAASGAERAGVWLAVLSAFGFSFKAVLIKLAYPYGVDAITLLALRMLLSLPLFALLGARATKGARLTRRDALPALALGLLGYYGASWFDFLGLQYVSAGLERLVLFTYPTLTVAFGVVLLGRAWSGREAWGLALTWVGIAVAVAHDVRLAGSVADTLTGVGLVLLSAVLYAGYLLGAGPFIARVGTARFTTTVMSIATVAVLVHFAALRHPTARHLRVTKLRSRRSGIGLEPQPRSRALPGSRHGS